MTGRHDSGTIISHDRRGGWMQTFSGRQFWPLDPRPGDVCIQDIARGLSNECRYGGQGPYYSVAQHSVLVSETCKPKDALWGLLHDAAEAYTGDMIRPLKHGPGMEAFRRISHLVQHAITIRFGLSEWEPESVKEADAILLATERRDLLKPIVAADWAHGARERAPLSTPIFPWSPLDAEFMFLNRFRELTDG